MEGETVERGEYPRTLACGCTADRWAIIRACARHGAVARLSADRERAVRALEEIRDYTTPYHYPNEEENAAYRACAECMRRSGDKFFPGNYCDEHYRVMVMKYDDLNDRERKYETPSAIREIARTALDDLRREEG